MLLPADTCRPDPSLYLRSVRWLPKSGLMSSPHVMPIKCTLTSGSAADYRVRRQLLSARVVR